MGKVILKLPLMDRDPDWRHGDLLMTICHSSAHNAVTLWSPSLMQKPMVSLTWLARVLLALKCKAACLAVLPPSQLMFASSVKLCHSV